MVNQTLDEIDDKTLLLTPDQWLENQRLAIEAQLELLLEELNSIVRAQRMKVSLQQKNLVVTTRFGNNQADIIEVRPLSEALRDILDHYQTTDAGECKKQIERQIRIWKADGYDVDTVLARIKDV